MIFLIIIILAAILRLYKLGDYPVSLSWDEVAIGYNAFSISKTGKDEYGTKLPLLFKSFNDYKLPGYIYLDAIFVKFLGLSEFSTRLPSALFGFLTVPAIYFLTKKLFENADQLSEGSRLKNMTKRAQELGFRITSKSVASAGLSEAESRGMSSSHSLAERFLRWRTKRLARAEIIALLAMFLLAISPWHLQFSRGTFEANSALTVFVIGITLLVYGLRNKWAALFSLPVLFLSIYFYYSPRILVPAMIIVFAILYRKEIIKNLQYFLFGLIISIIIIIPIMFQILSAEGLKRVKEVSIFKDQSLVRDYVEAHAKSQDLLDRIFLNRRIPVTFEFLHNYFSHFSPGFLFFGDDPNPRHRPVFHGNLYLFEIFSVVLGLWLVVKIKNPQVKYFLLAWLLISPIPAAFTQETPHGLRSLTMLLPIVMISAFGLSQIARKINPSIFFIIILISIVNYLYSYYTIYPLIASQSWAYGYKQMLAKVSELANQHERIIVTGHYWKPYIFYLFYNKIDPTFYQSAASQESIGKYRFGTTAWDSGGKNLDDRQVERLKMGKTLLILSPQEFEGLKDKEKFSKFEAIGDYSQKTSLFLIGEWQ